MADAPKSALELVLERLKKQDTDAGREETPLTEEQRAAITEARSVYESRVAERRIMHQSAQMLLADTAAAATLQEEFTRDLDRLATDRDAKIRKIREQEVR